MNQNHSKQLRVLAIAPSSRGFGFALLEQPGTLVDWGHKPVKGDKNAQSLKKLSALIKLCQPELIVLEDAMKEVRRSARIQELGEQIATLAAKESIKVKVLSRKKVRAVFFTDGEGTKQEQAELLAARFPDELGSRLPPKRKPWKSEDSRMDIFDAVALAVAF